MSYLVLLGHPDKSVLDDFEYYIKKFPDDVAVLKEMELIKVERLLNSEPIDVYVGAITFKANGDGIRLIKSLRQGHLAKLPAIFHSNQGKFDFRAVHKQTQFLGFLTNDSDRQEFEHFLKIGLDYSTNLKNPFAYIPLGKGKQKRFVLIQERTFSYARIQKKTSNIDVYEYDKFTGEKKVTMMTGLSLKKFLEYVKHIPSIKQCHRSNIVGKNMIVGYDGQGALFLQGGHEVDLGPDFEEQFINYMKKK